MQQQKTTTMLKPQLLFALCVTVWTVFSQPKQDSSLNVGDMAPPLRVKEWIKGAPVSYLEKEKVYVVEFWATWCRPCLQSLPSLSKLAKRYKHKVTMLAIDVFEKDTTDIEKARALVDKMRKPLRFRVAVDDNNYMAKSWLEAANEYSIPNAYLINGQGRIAWIGHPKLLPSVLPPIIKGTWNTDTALVYRTKEARLAELDNRIFHDVAKYNNYGYTSEFIGRPDSALLVIEAMLKEESKLAYAPNVSRETFYSLLKIDASKAYHYGNRLMRSKNPNYDAIIGSLDIYPYKYNTLPAKIFELGAQAIEAKINNATYPALVSTTENYLKMAEWYLLANNKPKARKAMRKAIRVTKR